MGGSRLGLCRFGRGNHPTISLTFLVLFGDALVHDSHLLIIVVSETSIETVLNYNVDRDVSESQRDRDVPESQRRSRRS